MVCNGKVIVSNNDYCDQPFVHVVKDELNALSRNQNHEVAVRICQKIKNSDVLYFTYYNKVNKIPLYSAYKFSSRNAKRKGAWKIEPQINRITMITRYIL